MLEPSVKHHRIFVSHWLREYNRTNDFILFFTFPPFSLLIFPFFLEWSRWYNSIDICVVKLMYDHL